MFSYPLQVHPCRASVDAVLKWRPNSFRGARNSPNSSPARRVPLLTGGSAQPAARNESISDLRFSIITTVIIILSYTVAMTVSSLDKVLAYVGSTGSTSEGGGVLGQGEFSSNDWRRNILRKLSLALAIYGLLVMILCLGTNLAFSAAAH